MIKRVGFTTVACRSSQIGRHRKALVWLSTAFVLFKETLFLMFDATFARNLAVGGGRALDFGRTTLETGNLGTLFGIGASGSVDKYARLLVLVHVRRWRLR